MPDEDLCAPCEVDFTPGMSGIEDNIQQMSPESYSHCRNICEGLLELEDESSTRKKAKAIKNCKCFCKELMLKHICSGMLTTKLIVIPMATSKYNISD